MARTHFGIYLRAGDGTIAFTNSFREQFGDLFARAGCDLATIATEREFEAAFEAVRTWLTADRGGEAPDCGEVESPLFLEAGDGRIVFTGRGRREMGDLFGRAGIPLSAIRTRADYLWARQCARPFFREHLCAMLDPNVCGDRQAWLEREMIRAILAEDETGYQKASEERERRRSMRVVEGL